MEDIIIVGDRVLIRPQDGEKQTQSGLYLPATVVDQERVMSGHVVRVGPGYVIPNPEFSESETWAPHRDAVRYLPLQAQPGDVAFFLRKEMVEISFKDTPYVIVSHSAILALVRQTPDDILKEIEGDMGDLGEMEDS